MTDLDIVIQASDNTQVDILAEATDPETSQTVLLIRKAFVLFSAEMRAIRDGTTLP